MAVAAYKIELNRKDEKWSEDEVRNWLHHEARMSADRSFTVTQRQLATTWGWSVASVRNLLKSMKMAGILSREVLPNNGGTRLTIVEQRNDSVVRLSAPFRSQAVKNDSDPGSWSFADIETLQSAPSKALMDKLSHAYHAIIYGKPGFESCDVEHLELIEQVLFPDMCPSLAQAA
ncbi:MAG: hypothetical protein L3J67_12965 [Hyphomicrobiaceae bacterium]|nr:hypothetical protein [Hyphomicrobiaceae bacterium]